MGRLGALTLRRLAAIGLVALALGAFVGPSLISYNSEWQSREAIDEAPSAAHPLGTDELGRDRLARLLYASRASLTLAPAAALLASTLAVGAALLLASGMPAVEGAMELLVDLFLSLPWLFLLLAARAALPLDSGAWVSAMVTFLLLAGLGWPAGARQMAGQLRSLLQSEFLLQARAQGVRPDRIALRYLTPHLRPLWLAQWLTLTPVFLLAESNLGMLGLGVAEPLASWGRLLAELETATNLWQRPWLWSAPLVVIFALVCFFLVSGVAECR